MTRTALALALALFAAAPCGAQQSVSVPAKTVDTSQFATTTQLQAVQSAIPSTAAMAAAAPVQAVNTKTGQVTVPTLCRQQSTSMALPTVNPGVVSWTFPNATCSFSTPPSCWMDMATSSTGWAFDQPVNTSRTTTAVTYSFTAHSTTLNISLGSLSLSVGPPANSTVVMTCTAPPA